MIVHNLNPILLSIGPISIRWYGLVYVLGFVAAYVMFRKYAKLSAKEADSLTLWLIIGLLLGARSFFFAFYRPDMFSIVEFFSVWNGGMSFHGALLGLGLAAWLWCRKNNQSFGLIADAGAITAAFFLALGRIANFVNAEIVGTHFAGAWCVKFPTADGCRHPVQLYAMIKNLIIGGVLVGVARKGNTKPGFIFWIFASLYGLFRFIVQFWRADPILFAWAKMGHLLSLVLLIIGVVILVRYYKEDLTNIFKRGSGKKQK